MKAYIIYLKDKENSSSHAYTMLGQLQGMGIDAELFDGVPGDQAVRRAEKDQRVCWPYSIKSSVLSESDLKEYLIPELRDEFYSNHFYKIYSRKPVGDDAINGEIRSAYSCELIF